MINCPHCGGELAIKPVIRLTEGAEPTTVDSIIEEEAERAGVTRQELTSRCRNRNLTIARYRVMERLRGELSLNYGAIGRRIKRDPSTVRDWLVRGPIYDGMEVSK